MMQFYFAAFVALLIFGFASCHSEVSSPEHAFYFWKQGGTPNQTERAWLDSLQTKRIYMRIFDIDIDAHTGKPAAISVTKLPTDTTIEMIPVIFITERTVHQLADNQVDSLSNYIVAQLLAATKGAIFGEFQVDCDWTAGSRSAYFRLLLGIKSQLGTATKLTVTLRLHQWLRPTETGIPPADAAVLMCYNTGQTTEWTDTNAILSVAQIKTYTNRAPHYPLPIDVALPVFSWARIWRDGLLVHLVHGATAKELRQQPALFIEKEPQLFDAVSDQYWHGHYLYRGDLIRVDEVSEATLQAVSGILATKTQPKRLIWYHLDSANLSGYSPQHLKKIAHSW